MRLSSYLTAAMVVFCAGLSAPPFGAQNQTASPPKAFKLARHFDERPPLQFEPAPTRQYPGRVLVTNLHQDALTAFAVESHTQVYDAFARVGMISTIPRGLTLVIGIPHIVGKPVPPAKIVAAIWEDGSTFGPAAILERIFASRRAAFDA